MTFDTGRGVFRFEPLETAPAIGAAAPDTLGLDPGPAEIEEFFQLGHDDRISGDPMVIQPNGCRHPQIQSSTLLEFTDEGIGSVSPRKITSCLNSSRKGSPWIVLPILGNPRNRRIE